MSHQIDVIALPAARVQRSMDLLAVNSHWQSSIGTLAQAWRRCHPVDCEAIKQQLGCTETPSIMLRYWTGLIWSARQVYVQTLAENEFLLILTPVCESLYKSYNSESAELAELLGNVVHSFNNYLSAMMGFTELAMLDIPAEQMAHEQLQTVIDSGNNAVGFSRDLLASAKRSVQTRQKCHWPTMLATICTDAGVFPPPSIPELEFEIDTALARRAVVDFIKFLSDDAKEATCLDTAIIELNDTAQNCLQRRPGRYLGLLLRNESAHLTTEQATRLFEPYYSSKVVRGKKGMGLAPAHGLWQQMGGIVCAYGGEGQGSAIILLYPLALSDTAPAASLCCDDMMLLVSAQSAMADLIQACVNRVIAHVAPEQTETVMCQSRWSGRVISTAALVNSPAMPLLSPLQPGFFSKLADLNPSR